MKPSASNKVLPKDKILLPNFSRPEVVDSPLIKPFSLNPFTAIKKKLRDISKRLQLNRIAQCPLSRTSQPSSEGFQRPRAKSSILDIKIPLSSYINKKGSGGPTKKFATKDSASKDVLLNRERKSSLSVFENFTGRKVSEYEYYADSPLTHPLPIGIQDVYYASKKIDRIKR